MLPIIYWRKSATLAKQYDKAEDAATAVIGDPNMALMTARFGTRKDGIAANGIYPAIPGDVYWDLFQPRNQNRKTAGNKEALWVIQFETDVPGGGNSSTKSVFEGDAFYALERVHSPLLRDVKVNGVAVFQWPVSDFTGGRGVGFMAPNPWFADSVWKNAGADMRNANHNFVRDFIGTNPASPLYGKVFSTKNIPAELYRIQQCCVETRRCGKSFVSLPVESNYAICAPGRIIQ